MALPSYLVEDIFTYLPFEDLIKIRKTLPFDRKWLTDSALKERTAERLLEGFRAIKENRKKISRLDVFAMNYNFLLILDGMGGLRYTS